MYFDLAFFRRRIMKKLLTPEELADYLGITPAAVRRLANDGHLPAVRLTHQTIRFDLAVVLKALAEHQAPIVSR